MRLGLPTIWSSLSDDDGPKGAYPVVTAQGDGSDHFCIRESLIASLICSGSAKECARQLQK
jgi:hypothetical protein